MSSSSAPLSAPEGPGSVRQAPHLPAGFTNTFTSRYIDIGGRASTRSSEVTGRPLLPGVRLAHESRRVRP
jgi:hypothetical protein